MREIERRREERRARTFDQPAGNSGGSATVEANFIGALDELISNTVSSESEQFIQEGEQHNGE